MEDYSPLERLQESLSRLNADAKAEAQVALALEEGLAMEDLSVGFDSFFFREYSKDILYSELKEDAAHRFFLGLHLTRSGIADSLPEALFFPPPKGRIKAATDMAEEYRANKKRMAGIRRFFQPFEHHFFGQSVQVEQEEAALLQGLETDMLTDYFAAFWNLSPAIPKRFLTPLILLLPYAHQITGNLPLTQNCLQLLLGEEVSVVQDRNTTTDAASLSDDFSHQSLGIDALCGQRFEEDTPLLHITIGPLKTSAIHNYLEGGSRYELLNTFVSFFVPIDADVKFEVEVPTEKRAGLLGTTDGPVLGYSGFL